MPLTNTACSVCGRDVEIEVLPAELTRGLIPACDECRAELADYPTPVAMSESSLEDMEIEIIESGDPRSLGIRLLASAHPSEPSPLGYVQQDTIEQTFGPVTEEDVARAFFKPAHISEEQVRELMKTPGSIVEVANPLGLSSLMFGSSRMDDPEFREAQSRTTASARRLLDNTMDAMLANAAMTHMGVFTPTHEGSEHGIRRVSDLSVENAKRRESFIFKIWDWPRGTRKRRWGLLHDQIWFYDEPPDELWTRGFGYFPGEPQLSPDGKWWRRHKGRWMRLYMDRKMLWLGPLKFRFHTFHSGDDRWAPHTHPFSFVTIPLRTYTETVMEHDPWIAFWEYFERKVTRWIPHYRGLDHCHFVHEPERPFSTIVIAWERKESSWGFRMEDGSFIEWGQVVKYE